MAIVTSKANEILNDLFKTTYYIGLSTSTPNQDGGNVTEPSPSTGYKRMLLSAMGSASKAQITNKDIIFFPETLTGWGTVTHFVIYPTQTATTPIYYGNITGLDGIAIGVDIPADHVPIFRAGAFKVALDKDVE